MRNTRTKLLNEKGYADLRHYPIELVKQFWESEKEAATEMAKRSQVLAFFDKIQLMKAQAQAQA